MFNLSSSEFPINDIDRVIGSAVWDILQSGVVDHITRKILIQHLTHKYVHIYESDNSATEALVYESAIKILLNSKELFDGC